MQALGRLGQIEENVVRLAVRLSEIEHDMMEMARKKAKKKAKKKGASV
jgi:hypothetical protein